MLRDETEFTPWAQPGWPAWDSYSPEQEFCLFVGTMQRMLQPETILETGVGIGRLTGHLKIDQCTYLGFESDPEWRTAPAFPNWATPTAAQMSSADLVILDSFPSYRLQEIALWGTDGKPGSVCIVHDCGNGHGPEYQTHHNCRDAVNATGQPGVFLKNPRGSWMGWHQ